jgi:hypothetical protein
MKTESYVPYRHILEKEMKEALLGFGMPEQDLTNSWLSHSLNGHHILRL